VAVAPVHSGRSPALRNCMYYDFSARLRKTQY